MDWGAAATTAVGGVVGAVSVYAFLEGRIRGLEVRMTAVEKDAQGLSKDIKEIKETLDRLYQDQPERIANKIRELLR